MNREEWLNQMVEKLRIVFSSLGYEVPKRIRISCSWPSHGGLPSNAGHIIGETWSPDCSEDETHEIFVSPTLTNAVEIGGVVVHELVHTIVGVPKKHGAAFTECARKIGH